jgi:hypothetical protein
MMPVSYIISRDDTYVLARYEGAVTLAQVTAMFAAYQQDPAFRPERPHLVDLSLMSGTDAGFADVFALFAMFGRSYAAANARMRCAIFAPSELAFGISRIFENLSETSDRIETALFDDFDAAVAWARGQPVCAPVAPRDDA